MSNNLHKSTYISQCGWFNEHDNKVILTGIAGFRVVGPRANQDLVNSQNDILISYIADEP
jgi:hypothetical protein